MTGRKGGGSFALLYDTAKMYNIIQQKNLHHTNILDYEWVTWTDLSRLNLYKMTICLHIQPKKMGTFLYNLFAGQVLDSQNTALFL